MTLTVWRTKGKKNQSDTPAARAAVKPAPETEAVKQADENTVKSFFSKLFG